MHAIFKNTLLYFFLFIIFCSNSMELVNSPLLVSSDKLVTPLLPVLSRRISYMIKLIEKHTSTESIDSLLCSYSVAKTYSNLIFFICEQPNPFLKTDFLLYYAQQKEFIRIEPFLKCKESQLEALLLLGWSKEQIDTFSLEEWRHAYTALPEGKTFTTLEPILHNPIALFLLTSINPNIQDTTNQSCLLHLIYDNEKASDEENYKLFQHILAQENTNPNIQDIHGNTPLHLVSRNDNGIDYVKNLLEHHAINTEVRNYSSRTPFDRAKLNKANEVVRLLRNHSDTIEFLIQLIKTYNRTALLESLKYYNSLNKTYKNLISYICEQQNPFLKTDFLLYYARQKELVRIEPFLKCKQSQEIALHLLGWDTNNPTLKEWRHMYTRLPFSRSFISIHTIMDDPIALRILTTVAPTARDVANAHSVLHCILQNYSDPGQSSEQYESVEKQKYHTFSTILQRRTLDPNIQDHFGNTPMHYLCRYPQGEQYVKVFLKHPKILPFTPNFYKATPLDWAERNKADAIVKLLEDYQKTVSLDRVIEGKAHTIDTLLEYYKKGLPCDWTSEHKVNTLAVLVKDYEKTLRKRDKQMLRITS
jgi:ankyrin repeat protein